MKLFIPACLAFVGAFLQYASAYVVVAKSFQQTPDLTTSGNAASTRLSYPAASGYEVGTGELDRTPSLLGKEGGQSYDGTLGNPFAAEDDFVVEALELPADGPTPTDKTPPKSSLNDKAKERLAQLAIALMDLIVPSFVILGSAFMTRFLFMRNYTIGLFCGAAFVGLINIAVPSDSQSLITIQFGILISYLLFHGAFCRLRTIEIELGLGFVIGVTTGAVLVLAILSLIPKLADVWKYNTDLDGIWSFLPIHLVSFVLGAFAVDTIKPYIKKTSGSGNVLPVTVQDLPPATTSGREDQALPLHHRVNASSNAVQ